MSNGADRQISRERRPIDFNDLFSKNELTNMPVGKCISSDDGKILACRTDDNEWMIDSNTDKFKGRMKVSDIK